MGYLTTSLALLVIAVLLAFAFVKASPRAIADTLRFLGPALLCLLGLILIFVGRVAFGLPILILGGTWLMKNRRIGALHTPGRQTSTVRSAWLEMQLDHETGDLDGLILTGSLEGQILSRLEQAELTELYLDLVDDNDSAALLEAYLDRRFPSWRENVETSNTSSQRGTSSSGAMSKEEAYQVLGLSPGAGSEEIRSAHRRLMKAVHPDSGGSTFLAARINEAKQTLLD